MALCATIITVIATTLAHAQYAQYRMVQGKIVPRNSRDWTVIRDGIEVIGFNGPNVLCRTFAMQSANATTTVGGGRGAHAVQTTTEVKVYKETFELANYPGAGGLVKGNTINPPIAVMRVTSPAVQSGSSGSVYRLSSGYTLYDYGVDYTPPPRKLTPEETAAAQAEAAKTHAAADAAKLRFEQQQAEDGRELYQYRIGMRYLKGDGVPADTVKALEYLSKAAAQGNEDAKKQLTKLSTRSSQPQTNASPPQAGEH